MAQASTRQLSKVRIEGLRTNAHPLAGCRVLVSRAKKQAGALSSELRERGCNVVEIPFIEIRKPSSYKPLDSALRDLATYDWLILTSVNGVEALFDRLAKKKINASALVHLKIAAIGPATQKVDRGTWPPRHRHAERICS